MDSSIRALSGIDSTLARYAIGSTSADAVGATTADTTSASAAFGLTTDDFFSLFLAQLKNQDPTSPMDNSQMMTQMSQLTMIQTLQDVSKALSGSRLAESAGLIGKQVTGFNETGDSVTGTVERVDQTKDGFWLIVGADRIAPDSVSTVTNVPATA